MRFFVTFCQKYLVKSKKMLYLCSVFCYLFDRKRCISLFYNKKQQKFIYFKVLTFNFSLYEKDFYTFHGNSCDC